MVRVGTGVGPKGHRYALAEIAKRQSEKPEALDSNLEQLKTDVSLPMCAV